MRIAFELRSELTERKEPLIFCLAFAFDQITKGIRLFFSAGRFPNAFTVVELDEVIDAVGPEEEGRHKTSEKEKVLVPRCGISSC